MAFQRIILPLLLILISNHCLAQRTAIAYGEYTYYATESTSIEEAKRIALDRAKTQAIADEFGTNVSQSATTAISTLNSKSDTHFFFLGTTDIKGEWIETINAPVYSIKFENSILSVNCKVKGKIREIIQPEIEIEAKTLKNGITPNFESNDYKDGDDLYIQFKATASGNIIIFLVQNDIVYRLLPYKRDTQKEYAVIGGENYIFFSKAHGGPDNKNIDEYELFADRVIDFANILILYTPNTIGMNSTISQVYDEPLSMDFESFNKWLIKKRHKDKFSRVITIPLTIRKS